MKSGKPTRRLRLVELLESRLLLAGDPLAEWRFDSSSGTVLVDSIGTSNGTITGSSVFNSTATAQVAVMPVWTAASALTTQQWGTGARGGALRLFSDTDGALVAAADAPQLLSVSFWFKADNTNPGRYNSSAANGGSTSSTSVTMPLFELGSSTSGLNVYIYSSRLYVGAWVSGGGAGNETFLFSGANAILAGRWHHVALALDPVGGATGLRGYLDGTQFGQGAYRAVGSPADIGIGRADGTSRFLLGTSGSSVANNDTPASNNHRGFAGYLDEMRVYNETLAAQDVIDVRDATAPTVAEEEWLIRDSGRAATIGRFRFAGQLASEHFVMKWGNSPLPNMNNRGTSAAGVVQGALDNLNRLEMAWDVIVDQAGMAPPAARNGATYKINLYVLDTGLWFVDAGGGTFSGAFAGDDPTGFAAIYTSPWALGGGTTTIAPWGTMATTTVTPHEFTHALQAESNAFTGNNIPGGPFWEAHANFGSSLVAAQTPANNLVVTRDSIRGRYGRLRHRYALATDKRYQDHPFLNWLYDYHGNDYPIAAATTAAIWNATRAGQNNQDPYQVIRSLFPSYADFAATYARYVASTVTYKELHNGALLTGSPAIPAHHWTRTLSSADRFFRTYLEPVATSPGWYQVPEAQTPEQYGANIIPLTMQGKLNGQTLDVTVDLDGYTNPGQANGIYATLVAVWGSGASTQEAFSPTWQSGELTWTVPAAATHLYLTVTAIPTAHRNYIWSHPYHPVGVTTQKLEHFPYRVSMTGAVPTRNEVESDRPAPSGSAVRHINPDGSTGGWKTVSVPATVYIAYNAAVTGGSVSGNARIEDRATVTGGTVSGSAMIRGHATVTGGLVTDDADVSDYAVVAGGTVRDFARLRDNAFVNIGTVRGDALVAGYATVGTGVFDQGSASSGALVSGTTVIKGFGYVAGAPQMTGNAMVMASGIGSTDRVTTIGVQYNGEPSDLAGTNDELGLEDVDFQNLFARYLFTTQDNNVVWDNFNTTYGWMSDTPATWLSASGVGGLSGVLEFANEDQFVDLSPELADMRNETIQFWTRWDGTGGVNQKIFEFARDADNYLYLQPTSLEGGVKFVIAVDGVVRTLRGADPLAAGQWQHVAVTFSGDTAKLYVNASAVSTWNNVTMDPYQVGATSALLGRGLAPGGGYQGRVDNLLVYSDARTPAEILTDVRAILGAGYVPAPDAPADQDPPSDVLVGDYNQDGSVDAADYVVWRKVNGQTVTPGTSADGTGDGFVDEDDYGVWAANFGSTQLPPAAAVVAEPVIAMVNSTPASASAASTVSGALPLSSRPIAVDTAVGEFADGHVISRTAGDRGERWADIGRQRPDVTASHQSRAELALLASFVESSGGAGRAAGQSSPSPANDADDSPIETLDRRVELAVFWDQLAREHAVRTKMDLFPQSSNFRGTQR